MNMAFTKMHGTGNDYIYVDGFKQSVKNPSSVARKLSDRHTGIGGDGLILILPSKKADVRMQMFNADGSEGAMCGNGIRCVAKYAYDHGLVTRKELTVETKSGIKRIWLTLKGSKVTTATVDMGVPDAKPKKSVTIDGIAYSYFPVSMGNPHAVIFVSNITDELVLGVGPRIEKHPDFPDRTNVEFVKARNKTNLDFRVWERGSGETMSCGTGACAAVVAGAASGVLERKTAVHLRGGDLLIDWRADGHVYMTGNAVEVFSGTVEI